MDDELRELLAKMSEVEADVGGLRRELADTGLGCYLRLEKERQLTTQLQRLCGLEADKRQLRGGASAAGVCAALPAFCCNQWQWHFEHF